jgi:hypothetical protein
MAQILVFLIHFNAFSKVSSCHNEDFGLKLFVTSVFVL